MSYFSETEQTLNASLLPVKAKQHNSRHPGSTRLPPRVTKSTRYTDVWPRFNEAFFKLSKDARVVYRRDANVRELINAFAIPILKTMEFDVFATSRLARHGIICHKTNEIVSDVDVKYNATEDESS